MTHTEQVPLERPEVVRRAPCTFGQLSLWRSIRDLPAEACNLPEIWQLPAGTTADAVRRALEDLEERHESLRTRFEVDSEHGLNQLVYRTSPPELELVEAGDAPEEHGRTTAQRLAAGPFDLSVDRPWRAGLVTSHSAPAVLVLCFHHIAADGWSLGLLKRDFFVLLDGSSLEGTAPNCCELASQQWSAEKDNRRQAARAYWQQILQAAPAMERDPRAGALATRWAKLTSTAAAEAAGEIAARLSVSVPSVVLAAFASAVARRDGGDRVLVAVFASNRSEARWRNLVATQDLLVPLLFTIDPAETFDALVHRTHWETVRSYKYGMYNVDDVVELGREHGYSGSVNGSFAGSVSGFFRYFFNYLGTHEQEVDPAAAEMESGDTGRNIGAPLYLQVQDGRSLICTLRENSAGAEADAVMDTLANVRDVILTAAGRGRT